MIPSFRGIPREKVPEVANVASVKCILQKSHDSYVEYI